MRRRQLFEIEDQPWCPRVVRDGLTAHLQATINAGNFYGPIVCRFAEAIRDTGATRIVDMCAGGGGPWPRLLDHLAKHGVEVDVVLTDKYPNRSAFHWVAQSRDGRIAFRPESVDAARVPEDLRGFRTLFSAFHHFPPDTARAILADAVRTGQPIAIFEFTSRHPLTLCTMLLGPVSVRLFAPFVRPLTWSRLVFTYLVPLIPLCALIDGLMSCFRTYSPAELRALAAPLDNGAYTWDIGQARRGPLPAPIIYLIGRPGSETQSASAAGIEDERSTKDAK